MLSIRSALVCVGTMLVVRRTSAFAISRLAVVSPSTTTGVVPIRHATALFMSTGGGPTLYGHQGSRSPLVNWACYELDIKFQMAKDLRNNPHPFGQLPCMIDDDGVVLFESGAILQYLQSISPKEVSAAELASILSWITWANASLDPICFLETPNGKVYDTGLRNPGNKRLLQLDSILSKHQYLVPSAGFTLADVAVSSYLLYVLLFFPDLLESDFVTAYPNIARYMTDCVSRPAYAKAFGQEEQERLYKLLSESVTTA